MTEEQLRDGFTLELCQNGYLDKWYGGEGLKKIIEALDCRSSKKPNTNGTLNFCPKCNHTVWEPYQFCEICGQKIDWGLKK